MFCLFFSHMSQSYTLIYMYTYLYIWVFFKFVAKTKWFCYLEIT